MVSCSEQVTNGNHIVNAISVSFASSHTRSFAEQRPDQAGAQ